MTLNECLTYTLNNNLQFKLAENRQQQSNESISENRAKLLPQINGSVNFNDNFEPPVSATDQSANGVPYHVTHTLQYSTGMGFHLNMPLYNQTLLTSIKLVNQSHQMSILQRNKLREDLIVNTAKIYFMAQVTKEQISLLEDNIRSLTELRNHTAAFYENGMVLEVDLQRVDLNLSKLKTAKDNATLILQQHYNTLKYMMDYPIEKEIDVSPTELSDIDKTEYSGLSNELPELLMLYQSKTIAKTQLQMYKQEYIPTLSFTGFMQWSAWTGDLKRWGEGYPDNKLWNSYGVGLTLKIPIFDGFHKRSKINRGKLDVINAELQIRDKRQGLQTEYINALSEQINALQTYYREKESYELAQRVYHVTSDQYTEGVATMTTVLQDQMNINQSLSGYLKAYLDYRLANLTILKLSGQINNLLK